ncbi:dr1-associated corepressor-like isoform X1 [Citrus clementina]|uniref:dr1-associated corepressor-like isoform X1 n=2 Tax=Citrus clementina TaxID=85681 RepID=UPI000CED6505|nr:dr1-associated corepressor-like isoform X1 [Citrus x clementina]XP_024040764.1 dr1-associated corepressor-like isoform X1 [Citrus x clementina]
MRKKLDTRFPAARIKKIMQADEDVGKIALAVPVLVSKALELFFQDLCDRTYEITLQRGAKTMSSLHFNSCLFAIYEQKDLGNWILSFNIRLLAVIMSQYLASSASFLNCRSYLFRI